MLTVFLLVTLTFSGVLASPAAFASSASPSFKHVDLVSPNPQNFGLFGDSVAISGNIAVVGAPYQTVNGEPQAGNAYVFNAKTGALLSTLASPDPQSGGEFGTSVAISGSLVVVGAPYETSGGQYEGGNAYVFNASTGDLITTLVSGNIQAEAFFGYSVSVSGGVAVVGAWGEGPDGGLFGAGSAFSFNATTGALLYTLTSPNSQEGGNFGYSVAVAGGTVVVGAWGEDEQAGRAYLFDVSNGSLTETLVSPNNQEGGSFGASVAISGKVAVVGAYEENIDGQSSAGDAYTFNARTGSLISQLNSDPQQLAFFGASVAIDGDALIVGAPQQTTGKLCCGVAFTFNAKTGTLTHTLTNPNKNDDGNLGVSVSVGGESFVVGAPVQIVRPHHKCGEAFIFQLGS